MIAGGVRVPGGFAVTTDAYAMHLRSNGLGATIAERLSRIEVDNVDEEEALSHEIRDAIVAQAMPAIVGAGHTGGLSADFSGWTIAGRSSFVGDGGGSARRQLRGPAGYVPLGCRRG